MRTLSLKISPVSVPLKQQKRKTLPSYTIRGAAYQYYITGTTVSSMYFVDLAFHLSPLSLYSSTTTFILLSSLLFFLFYFFFLYTYTRLQHYSRFKLYLIYQKIERAVTVFSI